MAGHHVDVSAAVSFEDVVNEVYEPLQRYLRRRTDPTTAEDVLADVLLVLWRRVDDIPAGASIRLHRATAKLKRELVRRKDTGTPGHLVEQAGMEEK